VKPIGHGKHVRNHSKMLSDKFKKEAMIVVGEDEETNEKLNIDGNVGIGNITSSDEDYPNATVSHNEQRNFENRLDDTSIGDCEIDEDPGTGYQQLQQ